MTYGGEREKKSPRERAREKKREREKKSERERARERGVERARARESDGDGRFMCALPFREIYNSGLVL